jgi:SIR2-like domain
MIHLDDLRKDYHSEKIVPLIGAGFSVPFKIPNWADLIRSVTTKFAVGDDNDFIKKAVEIDLGRNDYWGAIDMLKKYTPIEEEDIQKEVSVLIQNRLINLDNDSLHNYSDLCKMNFKFYLTTNYENLLQKYLNYEIQPILLKDILFSSQELFDQKRVCHLHGTSSNYGTIVISRESYKELYKNKKYDDLLKLVTGNKKLLFMGFSFDDQFISTLIKEHRESFKGNHYILLANPTEHRIRELRSNYGLLTIPYKTQNSSHTIEIRKILNDIAKPLIERDSNDLDVQTESPIIIGAGLRALKKDMRGSLFFKKLELENIDETMIDLCSAFYLAAEEYIRAMSKLGITIDVIDVILGQVFLEYKEQYINTYQRYGDSERFLTVVHESLKEIDFGRYDSLLKENKTNKNENRGFVHVLANNEEEDIWWGKERFNEEPNV